MSKNENTSVVAAVAAAHAKPTSQGKASAAKHDRKGKPASKPSKPKATLVSSEDSSAAFTITCSRSLEGIKRTLGRLSVQDKEILDQAAKVEKGLRKSLERQLLAAGKATIEVKTSVLKYSDGYVANIVKASVFHPSTVVKAA
jgi:hypothetical protein